MSHSEQELKNGIISAGKNNVTEKSIHFYIFCANLTLMTSRGPPEVCRNITRFALGGVKSLDNARARNVANKMLKFVGISSVLMLINS